MVKEYGGKQIDIFVIKNSKEYNLLGIAVSKKAGNSVYRNKIKRIIRENYRLLENSIKEGYSFVILWNKKLNIKDADFYIIKEDIISLLSQIKMLKE